jgi:very-short-patch-repair endonuclease
MKRGQRDAFPPTAMFQELKPRVRDLHREATPAEKKLWAAMRDGKLGHHFEKHYRRERFYLDFFCPEARLAIEIEGHVRTAEEDAARLANLEASGVRLLRFSNDDVLKRLPRVLKVLSRALEHSDDSR